MNPTHAEPGATLGSRVHETPAIEVQSLTKEITTGFWGRRVRLLDDVTFTVPRGATVGFIGNNGAGKSTTIKHIIGGAAPTSGTVKVLGEDPRAPRVRQRFGYMPELPHLPPTLTPREMMRLHGALYGLRDHRRFSEILTLVGLEERATQRLGSMSKGQQTRLSLALALLHTPEVLILDEPMSGLDPAGRLLVRRLLRQEADAGRTILFSSHVLTDVEALCDAVIVIERGRVVFSGPTAGAVGAHISSWLIRVQTQDGTPPAGVREVRREGDTLMVVMDGNDGIALAASLQARGARVLSVEPVRASLEDRLISWMRSGS